MNRSVSRVMTELRPIATITVPSRTRMVDITSERRKHGYQSIRHTIKSLQLHGRLDTFHHLTNVVEPTPSCPLSLLFMVYARLQVL